MAAILQQLGQHAQVQRPLSCSDGTREREVFAIRYGIATAEEQIYIHEFCAKSRHVKASAQFVQDNANDRDDYTVSFVLGNVDGMSRKAASLISEEDTTRLCFGPLRTHGEEGKPCADEAGLFCHFLNSDVLPGHTGTHVLRVRRSMMGENHNLYIPSASKWSPDIEYVGIYLKMTQSKKTTLKQMTALRRLNPTYKAESTGAKYALGGDETLKDMMEASVPEEPQFLYDDPDDVEDEDEKAGRVPPYVAKEFDFTRQREVVMGRDISNMTVHDFLGTLSEQEVNEIF